MEESLLCSFENGQLVLLPGTTTTTTAAAAAVVFCTASVYNQRISVLSVDPYTAAVWYVSYEINLYHSLIWQAAIYVVSQRSPFIVATEGVVRWSTALAAIVLFLLYIGYFYTPIRVCIAVVHIIHLYIYRFCVSLRLGCSYSAAHTAAVLH